jgi:hypothetical protein
MEEDVCALLEVTVQECSRGGMACRWNWPEADHVLVELGDEVQWIPGSAVGVSRLPGMLRDSL